MVGFFFSTASIFKLNKDADGEMSAGKKFIMTHILHFCKSQNWVLLTVPWGEYLLTVPRVEYSTVLTIPRVEH